LIIGSKTSISSKKWPEGAPATAEKWEEYLETGSYNFNPDELKR